MNEAESMTNLALCPHTPRALQLAAAGRGCPSDVENGAQCHRVPAQKDARTQRFPHGLKNKQRYRDPRFRARDGPKVGPRGPEGMAGAIKEGFPEAVSRRRVSQDRAGLV